MEGRGRSGVLGYEESIERKRGGTWPIKSGYFGTSYSSVNAEGDAGFKRHVGSSRFCDGRCFIKE